MATERPDRCETCRFWDQRSDESSPLDLGRCRRFPPVMLPEDKKVAEYAEFPLTMECDWCGEWRAKDVPTTAG